MITLYFYFYYLWQSLVESEEEEKEENVSNGDDFHHEYEDDEEKWTEDDRKLIKPCIGLMMVSVHSYCMFKFLSIMTELWTFSVYYKSQYILSNLEHTWKVWGVLIVFRFFSWRRVKTMELFVYCPNSNTPSYSFDRVWLGSVKPASLLML